MLLWRSSADDRSQFLLLNVTNVDALKGILLNNESDGRKSSLAMHQIAIVNVIYTGFPNLKFSFASRLQCILNS